MFLRVSIDHQSVILSIIPKLDEEGSASGKRNGEFVDLSERDFRGAQKISLRVFNVYRSENNTINLQRTVLSEPNHLPLHFLFFLVLGIVTGFFLAPPQE